MGQSTLKIFLLYNFQNMEWLIRAEFIMGSILKIGVIESYPNSQIALDSAFKYANHLNKIWYKFYDNFVGNNDTLIVEEETDEILDSSLKYIQITDSLFNPFYKSKNLFPIKISKNQWFFPKGIVIDLGGIAKGYLVDKIKDIILSFGIDTFFINFGSSSIYSHNYELNLYDETFGNFKIKNKAISISSTIRPVEKTYHIYNPKRQEFVKEKRKVLLICDNAIFCDALSKAIIINPKLKEKFKWIEIKVY